MKKMNENSDRFSFHKSKDGKSTFNINENINTKQATKELVVASIRLAIQQGYINDNTRTIEELIYQLSTEEEKKKFDAISSNQTHSISRERFSLDKT